MTAAAVASEADRRIGTLSKGFRQRVGLADALLGEPPLLVLDEPTSGMDPIQTRELRDQLIEAARERAVLVSSHAVTDLEALATRVAVLREGVLVAVDTPEALRARTSTSTLEAAVIHLLGEERARMKAAYWMWRRELAVTLRAPVVYVIGGLFLVVQGLSFAALVGALSDPRRPAPLGALLEGQLAGTLLTWVLQLVVLTLLGMRAIADERRTGGWELLLTAQVSERAAVVGKWLAATTVYALLWVPTLAYLGVIAMFRRDGGGWDLASIACGYAGAIALGAALLAWAIAASAATSTPLAAGGLGFALLVAWFLVGELPSLWPDLAGDHPVLSQALAVISLRARLTAFARGELELAGVIFVAALAVTGLSLAVVLACAGRRRGRELRARTLATVALAAIGTLATVLAVRHPHAWDVSAAHRNSLDPATTAVLAELPAPAHADDRRAHVRRARAALRRGRARRRPHGAGRPGHGPPRRSGGAAGGPRRGGSGGRAAAHRAGVERRRRRRARRPAPRRRRVRARDDRPRGWGRCRRTPVRAPRDRTGARGHARRARHAGAGHRVRDDRAWRAVPRDRGRQGRGLDRRRQPAARRRHDDDRARAAGVARDRAPS